MSFKKQTMENYLMHGTEVDNLFISEYMSGAEGDAVKQYLMAYMYASCGMEKDSRALAAALGITLARVNEIWDYWESLGLVVRLPGDDEKDCCISFVNLREEVFLGKKKKEGSLPAAFTMDERDFTKLLRSIESVTGRLLENGEPEAVASWLSGFGAASEVIIYAYDFCTKHRKSNKYRYVESVLKDWVIKGLDSREKVEQYLSDTDRHYDLYRKVMKELGFTRNATEQEKRIMDTWTDRLGFTADAVLEACKKTSGISNPNINYVNSVLTGWYKERGKADQPLSGQSLIVKVNALYEKDREENRKKSEAIRAKVLNDIPQMEALLSEIKNTGFSISKSILSGGGGKALREKMSALMEEKERLLIEKGFGKNALDPIYTCAKCRDTGLLESGERCSCFAEKAERISRIKPEQIPADR